MKNGIIVIAEHSDGQVRPVTYELIAFAAKLQAAESLEVRVFILGSDIQNPAEEIAEKSGFE